MHVEFMAVADRSLPQFSVFAKVISNFWTGLGPAMLKYGPTDWTKSVLFPVIAAVCMNLTSMGDGRDPRMRKLIILISV